MARHVLVVDDEPQIRDILASYLRAAGYDVTEAADGGGALAALAEVAPDLVLLDLGLPDMDGLDVLRRIRETCDVYVIVVTARAEEVDMLVGLAVGADDYVSKPFSPREVVARVGVVLRRRRDPEPAAPASAPADAESAGAPPPAGLHLDAMRREVSVDGAFVEPTALEFDLLAALVAEPGRVFSRRQLLHRVWGDDYFGDERVVDVHIRGLRKALGDDANDPRFIATVRGVGYKLLAPRGPRAARR